MLIIAAPDLLTGVPELLAGGLTTFADGTGASVGLGITSLASMVVDTYTNTLIVADYGFNRIRRITTSGEYVIMP